MTYPEFNKKMYDFYILRSDSKYCQLSIDDQEFKSVIDPATIADFEILKTSWQSLTLEVDQIPQYFGLIAIQCYAAATRVRSNQFSVHAYQHRLIELLGLDDENELQTLFRGPTPIGPIQEVIWTSAKQFFKNKRLQFLDIPSPTINAGRYVQYPKSQALLNTEELKRFTGFFFREFLIKENLEFSYFVKRLTACIQNIPVTFHMKDILEDPRKTNLCYQQLFNYYHRWEGDVFDFSKGNKNPSVIKKPQEAPQQRLVLIVEDGNYEFHLKDRPVHLNEGGFFHIKAYQYYHKDLLIFSAMPYYTDEYEDSRLLSKGIPGYILVNNRKYPAVFDYLKSLKTVAYHFTDIISLFRIDPSDLLLTSPLRSYYLSNAPVWLTGGLKLSKVQSYLEGFGPTISCDSTYSVFHDNKRQDYNPAISEPGRYTVRIDYYRDITFTIVPKSTNTGLIPAQNVGWDFGNYSIGMNPTIEGSLLNLPKKTSGDTREWITLNLAGRKQKESHIGNYLLRAINNSKA